jgi:Raf kinase inhibitor-like YbhB/YbcL family protein
MRFGFTLPGCVAIIALLSFIPPKQLIISSTAFSDNGFIPAKYSCEGAEVSPPLHITGIPKGTQSLAIIVHDPDAPKKGGVIHWVVWNIDVSGNIPENFKGADQGLNSANKTGYKGMCPPDGTHHYHFVVYALDTRLHLNTQTNKTGLEGAIHGHVMAQGELIGLYKKAKV